MTRSEKEKKIKDIENKLDDLPSGAIATKKVGGREYYYLRKRIAGKLTEKYIPLKDLEDVKNEIEERRRLEEELGDLEETEASPYYTNITTGSDLERVTLPVRDYRKREIFSSLDKYIHSDISGRVFILFGLRRTGKTTLMKQLILTLSAEERDRTAFIQITPSDTLSSLNRDLRVLEREGIRYVFIDEVTLLDEFIEGAAFLSDIYGSMGMKIVLSGTDSLGFVLSSWDELYDRTVMFHTTFIPYREFENVLGVKGIDSYILYGGTMCISGSRYNSRSPFEKEKDADEYVDSSIARNIQHSLMHYRDGGHFKPLYDLYEKNELTSAVNRVVEDMNHRFTVEVLTRDFRSSNLAISKRNLRKDRNNPSDVLEYADTEAVTTRLRELLEIRNRDEQTIEITDTAASAIKEYLLELDIIREVDVVFLAETRERDKRILISQPGLRYAQAKALIESLMEDRTFDSLPAEKKEEVRERILSEIRGRMLEDIILLETSLAFPKKDVFVLRFPVGEFDMVVADRDEISCEIYEIKHSDRVVPDQYRHLRDEEKCRRTEHFYGPIISRTVLYRGESTEVGNIRYMNIEEYLKSLPQGETVTWL